MFSEIEKAKEERKARILQSFKEAGDDPRSASPITKADFEAQYPESGYERYSLVSVHKFREDLMKSEEIQNKDEAFKNATKDLKSHIVHGSDSKVIMFTRKKVAGE
jgi:hypothetical protein